MNNLFFTASFQIVNCKIVNKMPTLVWKLLRQHISIGQLAGFFLANLFGMMIVLLSVQFYKDVIPVFTEGDSFMKKDFIIATRKSVLSVLLQERVIHSLPKKLRI